MLITKMSMAQFRNLGFLSKTIQLTQNINDSYSSNNSVVFRRHFRTNDNFNLSSRLLCPLTSICGVSLHKTKLPVLYHHVAHESTVAKDTTGASSKKSLADELLAARVGASGDTKDEAKPGDDTPKTEKEERERTLRALKFTYYAFGVMITGLGTFLVWSWGAPQKDAIGRPVIDEFYDMPILKQYIYRTISEARNMNKMIQEPARDKLLPDPLKEPYYQPPFTLILEMKDILVHPEWTYETGWRFKKRPGVDFLLQHCGPPLFEIVIYTSEQGFTAYPVIEQLDPNNFIWYKLFKDSTRYVDGKHLKDLNCVNRDLSKVIVIDWDREAITSTRNQLTLPRWKGNMNDQTLIELAMMLRMIAESQVSDVREVLDYYRTFDDPIAAFRENQRAAQERETEMQKIQQAALVKGLTSSWTSSFLRRK